MIIGCVDSSFGVDVENIFEEPKVLIDVTSDKSVDNRTSFVAVSESLLYVVVVDCVDVVFVVAVVVGLLLELKCFVFDISTHRKSTVD